MGPNRRRLLSRLLTSESLVIGILCLIGLIPWPTPVRRRVGRAYVYPPLVMLYQVMVYYNHSTGRPLRALKHMLGS